MAHPERPPDERPPGVPPAPPPPAEHVRAARGYLDVARGDSRKGFFHSACLTAQKAAEVALQAWVASRGMSGGAEGLPVLLAAAGGGPEELRRAALALERVRMDMHSPYRSFSGPDPDPTPEAARACCAAAEALVAHVELLFARGAAEGS